MRRLRLKFISCAIAVAVALAVGIHLIHRAQSRRIARALIGQADRAEKRGDRGKTAEYLERYLSYVPGDAAAMVRLGKVLKVDGAKSAEGSRRVANIYEKALALDPGLDEVRRELAEMDLGLGDYSAAQAHLEYLLEYLQTARRDDGALELLRGRCYEGLGRDEEAAEWYDKSRKHQPDLIESYVKLARLQRRRLSRPREADRVMDATAVKDGLIAANGQSARAYLERARYREEYKLPGVAEDVARAAELAPDDPDVILAASQVARSGEKSDLDRARALLRRGLDQHPQSAPLYLALSSLESGSGRPGEAAACLRRGVEALPEQLDLRWTLADVLITAGDLGGAAGAIEGLRKTNILPELLGFLDAHLLFQQRKWAEAARALEGTATTLATREGMALLARRAYLMLGRSYEQLGKVDQQFAAFRRAVDVVPPGGALDFAARLGLASSLVARDRLGEAIGEYRKILATPGSPPEIAIALARLLVLQDLQLPAAQRRWSDAERAVDDADKAVPGSPEVAILRAEILTARGRAEEAIALLRDARKRTPDRAGLWVAQATLEARRGQDDEALRLIDEGEARLGRTVELRSARAQYWARRGGPGGVAALAELERSAGELGPEDRPRFLGILANSYIQAGAPDRARRLGRQQAEEDPNNLPLRLTLFDQALVEGDEASASRLLGEIERLDPDGVLGPYGRALLLIRRSGPGDGQPLVEARRLLNEAARLRPNWSKISLAEARIDDIEKRPEAALSSYLRAIELGERGPSAILRATQLLSERGRYAQADQVFLKLQDRTALTGDQQRLAADLALRSRDFERALAQAKAALAADPKDYRNSLGLGRILYLTGRQAMADGRAPEASRSFEEAEKALRSAVELGQGAAVAHLALVQFLAETGRKDQARAALERARRLLPPKEAPLVIAQCLAMLDDAAGADEAYRAALAAAPDDPATLQAAAMHRLRNGRLEEAEDLLRRLAALEVRAPVEAAWARRTLALVMASGGNARRSSEALSLLEPTDAAEPTAPRGGLTTQDRRMRALVLSVQANRGRRGEAVGLLEGILREGVATPEDRFLLARLYESDGNWSKAREQLQALMASDAVDPKYTSYYTLSLLRRGQVAEAQTWVARVEKARPDSPSTVDLKARVLHASGRKAEALALISAYLRDHDAQVLPFAGALEVMKEYDEAEKLLRRSVAQGKPPGANFALIGFLGRRGRTKEAIDLCDAAWSPASTGVVANAYIRTLASAATADEATMARIAARFEAQLKDKPDDIAMALHLANLKTFQGRYAEAEAIYRSLADREKRNAVPLNNLAWLLALREGRGDEALPLIQRAIEIQGESPDVLDTRAIAYLALGRADDAVKDMENAIVRSPVALKYFHLARAYRMAGRRDDAGQALQKSKDLGLTETDIHPMERKTYDTLVAELARR